MPKKKLANKSRKGTLLKMLAGMGNLPGIEVYRTPGEDCAIRIAIAVIESTPIERIDVMAHGIKDAEHFWEKYW